MTRTQWQYGRVSLYTKHGPVITYTGAVRFERDATGFFADYEPKGDLAMYPAFTRIIAVRVESESAAGANGDDAA
jgi:NAD-dependent oxidoreductase involved in siderophore biosynthesis